MSWFKKEPVMDVKAEIINKIPTALKNLGVSEELRPLLQNYLLNRIIESSTELRKLSNKEFIAFLKSL